MNFLLDADHTAAASYRTDREVHSNLGFARNQPIGEGFGYSVFADRFSTDTHSTQFRSDIQYNAPAAVLRADYAQFRDQGRRTEDLRATVAGGIVAVGGHVALSRPVTESYAIVKVGDVPAVDIRVEGQTVGKTDSNGFAVVPNLSAYYDTTVSIASSSLPMEYALPAEARKIPHRFAAAPSLISG